MATIKRLCALQTCRSLWESPSCPSQEGAQPLRGLWQEEGKQPTAPAELLAALQPLCLSPAFLRLSIQSGGVLDSFLPYTSHRFPARTLLLAGHCNAKVGYRGYTGPCLTPTTVKPTMISEMQKYQGVQDW